MKVNGITNVDETFLFIEEDYQSSRTTDMQTRLLYSYYVSHDLQKFDRSVFTFWGALGDVGGLY